MKKRSLIAATFGAVAGVVVAALVLGFYFWETGHHQSISNQLLDKSTNYSLVICPPCFGVMALDTAGPIGWGLGLLEIAVANAILYSVAFVAIYKILYFARTNSR
ncbi:MAG TPA: hypothetical protein VGM16_06670 [Gammaproteobacteria bacterium]|jgi:hypothetical protein